MRKNEFKNGQKRRELYKKERRKVKKETSKGGKERLDEKKELLKKEFSKLAEKKRQMIDSLIDFNSMSISQWLCYASR